MAELSIRSATASDLEEINRIYNDAVLTTTATWDEEPWPLARREEWWLEHNNNPTLPVFVADAGNSLGGFAYLSMYRPKVGYRFTRENTVYVDPAFHRQGVGRALMQTLIDSIRGSEVHAIIAGIEATNLASMELHRSLGFVPVGLEREVGFKFGRWLDLAKLELVL